LIEVRDDGIGIPTGEQAQLFQRFFRASTATSREIPGSGLGLSIVRTIVGLHDGEIECRSSEGAGTTFLVSLPQAPAAEIAA
jgi:signal transduction histidine kinase